jgi:hypothetical protein
MPSDRTLTIDKAGTTFLQWPVAQVADVLDYRLDLTAMFASNGDIIADVVVEVAPSGSGELAITKMVTDGWTITTTLTGGVAGRVYRVRFDVGTFEGRQYSWVALLPVSNTYAIYSSPPAPTPGFGPGTNWALMELENQQGFWHLESGLGRWVWG